VHRSRFSTLLIDAAVDDAPRYHLDIETDDVAAETERLLGLGASPVGQWLDCRVLRAPGGHLLCVIPVHSDAGEFARTARVWECPGASSPGRVTRSGAGTGPSVAVSGSGASCGRRG
jgi:hypothetical protein